MKVQNALCVCVLAIVSLALMAEASYDLQRLLGFDQDGDVYDKRDATELEEIDDWEDLAFKRGVGTQKFITCFHPGLQTKCFCDRTKPKYSRNYFYYCRGAGRRMIRPV